MLFLYSVLIYLYYILVYVASFFNAKAKFWIDGRKNQFPSFKQSITSIGNRPRIWIHVSSYGEFEMCKPILDELQKTKKDIHFIISFYSPSGYERIELSSDSYTKIYLPLDQKRFHHKYLEIAKPSCFIFIKYDFWFNLLNTLKEREIDYYFIGLHLEADSYLFKFYMRNFLNLIKSANKIYVHSKSSAEILHPYGFSNLQELGDLRIPQVLKNKEIAYSQKVTFNLPLEQTIIYGSVSKFELPYILKVIKSLPTSNHILALHDLDNQCLGSIKKADLKETYLTKVTQEASSVLIVDNYGSLKYLYKLADIAYIGGAFEKGPHNVLEPLVFSIPVLIGPNIHKFPFAQECKKRKHIYVIKSLDNLNTQIENVLNEENGIKKEERIKYINSSYPKLAQLSKELIENLEENVN